MYNRWAGKQSISRMTTDSKSQFPHSAWQIWLHPRRSRREMESLCEERQTLQELLERTERERVRLLDDIRRKDDDVKRIAGNSQKDMDELKDRLRGLESTNNELNKELGEWRQTRLELDAIEVQMKEWEGVKARYEERIKMLTLRLRDALGNRSRHRGADSDSDILEEGETAYITSEERKGADQRKSDTDIAFRILSDMLPDPPVAPAPDRRRLPKDDTDWLITLPPE